MNTAFGSLISVTPGGCFQNFMYRSNPLAYTKVPCNKCIWGKHSSFHRSSLFNTNTYGWWGRDGATAGISGIVKLIHIVISEPSMYLINKFRPTTLTLDHSVVLYAESCTHKTFSVRYLRYACTPPVIYLTDCFISVNTFSVHSLIHDVWVSWRLSVPQCIIDKEFSHPPPTPAPTLLKWEIN